MITICNPLVMLQVDRQAREIVGLLSAANGFRQVTSGQKGIAARRVVSQVLHSLSKLGDALGGVLPSQVYVGAAGQVLQAVLETVIGETFPCLALSYDTVMTVYTLWGEGGAERVGPSLAWLLRNL